MTVLKKIYIARRITLNMFPIIFFPSSFLSAVSNVKWVETISSRLIVTRD